MLTQIAFPARLPLPSSYLPLTLISLEDWILVTINGEDTVKYLQGQLTCDLGLLDKNSFTFAAHCNVKGKMFSNMCLFSRKEGLAYIERRSVIDNQLDALKKYAMFSRITMIADDQVVLLGLAGFQAPVALSFLFNKIPNILQPMVQQQDTTLLYYRRPSPRFLLITTLKNSIFLQQKLASQALLNNSQQWLALDIEAGYPIIDIANSEQFIPQAVNLHLQYLNGISFNKGCYLGQEIIARTKYRGANRRTLYWLVSKSSNSVLHLSTTETLLELKVDNNWLRTGTLLAACQLENGSIWLQAVLDKDLPLDSILRVRVLADKFVLLSIHSFVTTIDK